MIKDFIPPVVLKLRQKFLNVLIPNRIKKEIIKNLHKSTLFNGNDAMFKLMIQNASEYVEVGCGQSTVFALNNPNIKKVVAIDTSEHWLELVNSVSKNSKLTIHHSDFGELGAWGRPKGYNQISKIHDYSSAMFKYCNPDLILIDGRFRVYCFLYACVNGKPGTNIIFDDYYGRDYYHIVEDIIKPIDSCGPQALFHLDPDVDRIKAKDLMTKFEFVMD